MTNNQDTSSNASPGSRFKRSNPTWMTPSSNGPFYNDATSEKGKKEDTNKDDDNDDDNDDDGDATSCSATQKRRTPLSHLFHHTTSGPLLAPPSSLIFAGLPHFTKICFRSLAVATITLYILNQKHMLPRSVGMWVSRALFWPTLPITVSRRIGKWTTVVDDTAVIGGAPFGFLGYPEKLSKQFGVKGVVNMCDEYRGPLSSYRKLGMEHLHLPTVDHFEPSVEDLKRAVSFIQKHEANGGRVFVHCRAGHGRSAAAVYAWLLYKEPLADPIELNEKLCSLRDVRKTLWKQPNVNIYRVWLQNGGRIDDSDGETENSLRDNLRIPNGLVRPTKSGRTRGFQSIQQFQNGYTYSDSELSTHDFSDDEDECKEAKQYSMKKRRMHFSESPLGKVFSDEESTSDFSSDEDFDDMGLGSMESDGHYEDEKQ